MRHLISFLTLFSGISMAAAYMLPLQAAVAPARETNAQIAATNLAPQVDPVANTKIVCSRNRPLAVIPESAKVASNLAPQVGVLASSIVQLFCRDVRINTIVVRDYCAVIRE
ncbi:hypothetical protein [Altericista sp. CCNU0014]|uniref:hypothetical protein n=1 Tax=Altericista sp. CCNU0014 TaxID=3082949 RepID=UPI003850F747